MRGEPKQALTEVHHQRWVKGQLFVIIAGIPTEVLQVRVLLDLKRGLFVRVAILRLNDAGAQSQAQRFGYVAFAVGKQGGVPLLNFQLEDYLGFLYPTVAFFQIHANWLFEIRQTDLSIVVTIHSHPPSARFFPDSYGFPCTYYTTDYYTTDGFLWIETKGFFYYSGYITYFKKQQKFLRTSICLTAQKTLN